ncbi:hypothetical protein CSOJ01_08221 [Colletotrichum sojae]|uniref:Uncharacterized protein n=1 Tax=Colletotrichum sojae TaxID=2175907 RepID=A0A8H6J7B4_9PEZI|nr:hypothetical protein CSOJ01_08221 [Colletotrichum sojae]
METLPAFNYDGPFPFHHIAWRDDPIETRVAWAKKAIAEGHDLNAIYSARQDGSTLRDTQARPLSETLWWPQNYNQTTGRMDDLDLLQLYLENGADPRLRDGRDKFSALEEMELRGQGDRDASQVYWTQARKLLEAKARELDDQEALARGEPPCGFLPRLKWQFGMGGSTAQQQQPSTPPANDYDRMWTRQVVPAFLLLAGLVQAVPKASLYSERVLAYRNNDESDELDALKCTKDTCGKLCSRSVEEDFTPITKRAYQSKTNQKSLDNWFEGLYPGNAVFDIGQPQKDRPEGLSGTRGYAYGLLDEQLVAIMPGLLGCTAIVIVDRFHAWMSHHWDTEFKTDKTASDPPAGKIEPGSSKEFEQEVLSVFEDFNCMFDKTARPETQALIYTRSKTGDTPAKLKNEPAFFYGQVEVIRKALSDVIPGLSASDIKVVPYYNNDENAASDKTKAAGKLAMFYENDAGGGNAKVTVWAGSLRTKDNSAKLEAKDNNDPIMTVEWKQETNQKKRQP